MIDQIEISALQKLDIPHITHLQPEDWNDIRSVFLQFIGKDFFYPVKAVFENRIVGVGEVLFTKNTAWIGIIVVDKSFRNNGIGTLITAHLSKYISSKNIPVQLLLATPLGKPVYEKLGFRHESDYVFMKRAARPGLLKFQSKHEAIEAYSPQFFRQIAALDTLATGEEREAILQHFTSDALLFVKSDLQGFYMPRLGDGLIIAKNNEAGFELLKVKWNSLGETVTLPTENRKAIGFAENHGFEPFKYAPKMILGDPVKWNPQMIFNRISGYLG